MPVRLPRFSRAPDYPTIQINRPKARLLQALARYTYLTAEQANRLLYTPSALRSTQRELSALYHAAFVQRLFLLPRGPYGAALAIYTLDATGHDWLKRQGLATESRFRASELGHRAQFFLRHSLACSDLLISSALLPKVAPGFELVRFQTEQELKRSPTYIKLESKRLAVIPDAWADFYQGTVRYSIAWELDRDTTEQVAFRERLRARLTWVDGPCQDHFGTDSITIAWVAAEGGQRRLNELLAWTEAELTEQEAQGFAELLMFSAFDPAKTTPQDVFLAPIWRVPFSSELHTLMPEPDTPMSAREEIRGGGFHSSGRS